METLKSVEVAWSAMFQEALNKFGDYEKAYPQLTEVYESRELTTNLAIVLGDALVRERRSGEDRMVDHLNALKYEVGIRKWALTLGVPMEYIEYDRLNIVKGKIQRMPLEIPRAYAKLVWDALVAGFTTNCWDGQLFFDTDHPYYTDEDNHDHYSNKLTEALSAPAFEKALARLQSIRRPKTDDPLNPCEDVYLFCSPQNSAVASEIVAPSIGKFNRNAGKAKVVVMGALSRYPTYWYLWDATLGLKPIFLKVNKRMNEIVALDQPKDPNVFWQDEAIFGAVGEHEVAYCHPMSIIGSLP